MKVNELLNEWFGMEKDPTIRSRTANINISDLQGSTYSVYAGSRKLTSGKTKQEADNMVSSKIMQSRFGKMTIKRD